MPNQKFGNKRCRFRLSPLKYESERELDWVEIGFAQRKQNLMLYLSNSEDWNGDLLSKLGKHKTGKGCLYVKRLSDVNESVLNELIKNSIGNIRKK